MTIPPPSRTADKFIVRLPDGMRDKLQARAEANGRSMNSEVVSILSLALGAAETQEIDELRIRLTMLNDRMNIAAQQIDAIAQEKRRIEQEIAVREAMLKDGRAE